MSTYFTNGDGSQIEFGVEICEKFQKFLHILDNIHQERKIKKIYINVFDDGFSTGSFSLFFDGFAVAFYVKANKEGFTLSFKKVSAVTGKPNINHLQVILEIGGTFSTTIKRSRYEVFESVMNTFYVAKKIKYGYHCG